MTHQSLLIAAVPIGHSLGAVKLRDEQGPRQRPGREHRKPGGTQRVSGKMVTVMEHRVGSTGRIEAPAIS